MTARVRCAVYTRKSSEEGLEQAFNSLDAQREACEAYIKSQRGLGWVALSTHYDDGGISGGTMERPALHTLLADVEERKVDLVVVYKIDRLTRSLVDFVKIVERLEAKGASFVSVTQQFNTATSMGRLTLNVLLSFAQFEREVTAERIRDKIAASKQKGMWMGGSVPLGYNLKDRKLIINPAEAKTVRTLFDLYLKFGTVNALLAEANRRGLVTKSRVGSNGITTGGTSFTRGHLYQLLGNPLYAGEIAHKGQRHPGQHEAIIESKTFDAVQQQLTGNAPNRSTATNTPSGSLLTGLVFDETGERLSPVHTIKNGRRYRYYISRRIMHGRGSHKDGWRLPAAELESTVTQGIGEFLKNPKRITSHVGLKGFAPNRMKTSLAKAAGFTDKWSTLTNLIQRVTVSAVEIKIDLKASVLIDMIDAPGAAPPEATISLQIPMQMRRRGVETKLIIQGPQRSEPDAALITTIARAAQWWAELAAGKSTSINDIAAREKLDAGDVSRMLPLAFLAPDIVEAILDGRQPVTLTAYHLKRLSSLPYDWHDQRQILGFAG
ncbi:MAG: recombinase family protein [Rhodospirillaceae bacterium]|nr:recombinase family protein [Rhodospirillaceae bacterium]